MPGPKTNEREGTRAFLRSAPMSAYKVREVLDLIRDKPVELAAEILRFCDRGAADTVAKVLASAVANAAANDELPNPEELFISACFADEGKTARRMRPRARGRATRIRKRSAHITVIVSRMPEDRLRRVRARQEVEQATRRGRRAGSRAAERGRPGRPTRRGVETTVAPAHEHEIVSADAIEAEGIVDPQAAAVEAVEAVEGGGSVEHHAGGTGTTGAGVAEGGKPGASPSEAGEGEEPWPFETEAAGGSAGSEKPEAKSATGAEKPGIPGTEPSTGPSTEEGK